LTLNPDFRKPSLYIGPENLGAFESSACKFLGPRLSFSFAQPAHSLVTMAKDGEPAKSVNKGKGKAIDGEPSKAEEVKKDKDGKPLVNGKQDGIIGGKWATSLERLGLPANGPSSTGRTE
jgi:hypothetical protein